MSIENSHAKSPETDCATVDDKDGVVEFSNTLSCLGSVINVVLGYTVNTESRVYKASESTGTLCFIWEDYCIPLMIK